MSSGRSAVRDRHFWSPLGGQLRELSAVHESAAMYLEWDIKARDELRYSCTHTRNQSERALPSRAKQERLTLEATDDLATLIVDPMSGNVGLGGKISAQPSASAHPPARH